MLLLVGDITSEEAKGLAEKYYAPIPSRPVTVPEMKVEPKWEKPKTLTVHDAEVNVPFVYRLYRTPSFFSAVGGGTPDVREVWALTLLADMLGGNTASPLYKRLVVEQQLADSAQTDFNGVSRGETTFGLYLQPKEGVAVETLLAAYDQALHDFAAHDLTPALLKRAQTRQKASDVYERDDTMGFGTRLGWWLTLGGTVETFDRALDDIDAVTLSDIKAVMRKYLKIETSTTGILLPGEAK
jgi:zinc protease